MTGSRYTYAVIHLPGGQSELVDLSDIPTLSESEAWDLARRRCTPSQRVVGIYQSTVSQIAVRDALAAIEAIDGQKGS